MSDISHPFILMHNKIEKNHLLVNITDYFVELYNDKHKYDTLEVDIHPPVTRDLDGLDIMYVTIPAEETMYLCFYLAMNPHTFDWNVWVRTDRNGVVLGNKIILSVDHVREHIYACGLILKPMYEMKLED